MKQRILILLLVVALILSACGQQPATAHTHSFAQEYTSDGTHHWRPCDCGEKGGYAEHKWDGGTVVKEPAAGAEGEMQYTCQICKATKTEPIAAEHVHSWDDGVVTVAPTQDSEGVKTFTCTQCGEEKTEPIAKLDPDHTHTFDMTASDEYSHWQACACGAKEQTAQHTWDGGVVTTPATAEEAGITTFTCTACGRKYTQIVPGTQASGLSFLKSTHYRMTDHLETAPLTLEVELYVPTAQTDRAGAVFSNYMGIRQDWHFEINENGVPRFYYVDTTGTVRDYKFTNVDVRTGGWVHLAFTFDFPNRTMSLYQDGVLAQTLTCDYDLAADITRYKFMVGGDGRSNNAQYFKGSIRSVAVYADVRTAEEIAASAQNGTDLYAEELLVAYLLNQNSGGKDICDLSGNGYDIAQEWLDSHETTLDYAYSFAVVGDTQWLSLYKSEKMEGIYDWILENKDSKKIAHVFGLGDITEGWNTRNKEAEWVNAQQYIYKLNGQIPYSIVRGNHDESKYFNKYFATEEYMSQFDGCFMAEGDVRNSYKLFTVGKTDYLFLTLDFGASDEALAWANEVVRTHPDHKVIVTTHGYQNFDGNRLTQSNGPSYVTIGTSGDVDYSVGDNIGRSYNNGESIWEKFVSQHPNIFLVMCGHTPEEDILLLQSEGNHGNVVNQMLINPQWMDPQKDGVGMVCMLYFNEDGTQMEVEWICTDTGKYYKAYNQFTLDLTDSVNAPAHAFANAYDASSHYYACDCGYIYGQQTHEFDGGVLNEEGLMVYSCACGYQRKTSATDDPVAQELQALLEQYYHSGVYYKTVSGVTTFYNGEICWTDDTDPQQTEAHLSLKDLILGKRGEQRLDLGWNCYAGIYSSVNEQTVQGVTAFVLGQANSTVTKVTVEEKDNRLVLQLYAGESLTAEAVVGQYAATTLKTLGGNILDVIYTLADSDALCRITAPTISGYAAEYEKRILDSRTDTLETTICYSAVSKWDGQSVSTSLKGAGTEADPYLIQSAADFACLQTGTFAGQYFKLTTSIDLNGKAFMIDYFDGTLNGNHCAIRGLAITNQADNTGLFKELGANSHICDLSLYGKVSGAKYTGALAGVSGGKVINVTNYAAVSGAGNLGGLIGNSKQGSLISNCANYGTVSGSSWNNGGIVGFAQDEVSACVNHGSIHTSADCAGGVVGTAQAKVSACVNYGTITASGRSGGVVYNSNSVIDGCVNYGALNSGWDIGGILGYVSKNNAATVSNCVNYGSINGSTGVGGIFGFTDIGATVIFSNCVNNGTVTGTWGVGGIAGNAKCAATGCVNNGALSARGELGGIIGKCYGSVSDCVNNGTVTGMQDIIGGIVGHLHDITYLPGINAENENKGTVTGPNAHDLVGTTDGEITAGDDLISVNHRGWYEAPENTLAAYTESYNRGWKYVECDVQFTADGVAVLLHDDTIDRTSNGSGTLSQMTYAQVSQFDFSYDDKDTENDFSAYRGEKIPTFEEFIALCKELGLHPYIEIKGSITEDQAKQLLQTVADAGMLNQVSWLSFSGDALARIAANCDTARIVWVITDVDAAKLAANNVPFAKEKLMTGKNVVVFDLWYTLAKQDVCDLLKSHGIPLEVWTVNDSNAILKLNPYVSGVSSDKYNARQVVAEAKANLGA